MTRQARAQSVGGKRTEQQLDLELDTVRRELVMLKYKTHKNTRKHLLHVNVVICKLMQR